MSEPRVALPEVAPDLRGDPVASSVLAHQPGALAAFQELYGVLWSRGVVPQAIKETARIRNARLVNCPICKAIRFSGARAEGLDESQVERIRDDWAAAALSGPQKAALALTDAFLGAPEPLAEEVRAQLLAEFSADQIVELAAGVALFMGFSKIAVSLGGLPDEIPVHEQPTPAPRGEGGPKS